MGYTFFVENLLKSKKEGKCKKDFTIITTVSVNFLVEKSFFFCVCMFFIDAIRLNFQFHILKSYHNKPIYP